MPESADGLRLAVRGVRKHFGAVTALVHADMDVRQGEVHGLVGENGAGKSTLVNIITGIVKPDGGEVYLDGRPVAFASVVEAQRAGITAVYQDPKLFGDLTVAENVFLGAFPRGLLGTVDFSAAREKTDALLHMLGVRLDPRRLAGDLSVAERQFVAICRALLTDAKLLILDEPTAALTPSETERLFAVVRRLRDQGSSALLISHRIEDIRGLTDSLTVLRDGRRVLAAATGDVTDEQIVEQMLGARLRRAESARRAPSARAAAPGRSPVPPAGSGGSALIRLVSLSSAPAAQDISFAVYPGEIVMLAGLVGSGRTEILETIVGLRPETGGEVRVNGHPAILRTPRRMLRLGVGLVPEDRDRQGLVLGFGVAENLTLPILRRITTLGFLRTKTERAIATSQAERLKVKSDGVGADVASLSGGNRQKVVVGKWLTGRLRLLLLDEPTRGVDVGAKAEIHDMLRGLAAEGLGILVASSDFKEVVALADRVIVLRAGRQVTELTRDEVTETAVAAAATLGKLAGTGDVA
jgi:rhamnose transport system ATP-binding protein